MPGTTVEPRFSEPLCNNEGLGITNDIPPLQQAPGNSKIYGKEPQ